MQDRPTLIELVEAVREFLETKAMPELTGHTAFHARVAVNVLDIALRELREGPGFAAAEGARLSALLGREGSIADLNRALGEAVTTGAIAIDDPALIDHLRRTTMEKLAIDNPKYAGYRRALARDAAKTGKD